MSKTELSNIINSYPASQSLELVESILKTLRQQSSLNSTTVTKKSRGKDLIEFAGKWDNKTSDYFQKVTEN